MSENPLATPKLVTEKDAEAARREIQRIAMRNLMIFVGVKALSYYAIYRLTKAVRNLDK